MVRFDGAQWQLANNLPDNVTQFAFAPDGSIWLGDQAGTVTRFDPAVIHFTLLPPRPAPTPLVRDPSLPTPPPGPTDSGATLH